MPGEVVDNGPQMSDSTSSQFRALDWIVSKAEKRHSHTYVEKKGTRMFRA